MRIRGGKTYVYIQEASAFTGIPVADLQELLRKHNVKPAGRMVVGSTKQGYDVHGPDMYDRATIGELQRLMAARSGVEDWWHAPKEGQGS